MYFSRPVLAEWGNLRGAIEAAHLSGGGRALIGAGLKPGAGGENFNNQLTAGNVACKYIVFTLHGRFIYL